MEPSGLIKTNGGCLIRKQKTEKENRRRRKKKGGKKKKCRFINSKFV